MVEICVFLVMWVVIMLVSYVLKYISELGQSVQSDDFCTEWMLVSLMAAGMLTYILSTKGVI